MCDFNIYDDLNNIDLGLKLSKVSVYILRYVCESSDNLQSSCDFSYKKATTISQRKSCT